MLGRPQLGPPTRTGPPAAPAQVDEGTGKRQHSSSLPGGDLLDRRELFRGVGSTAALALFPDDVRSAWARISTDRWSGKLSSSQLALISNLADVLIPRTDTPGALDVRVAAFIDALVSESWAASDRSTFQRGLDSLGARFGNSSGAPLAAAVEELERETSRRAEPVRTYWQLKSLIVHGYFTSERVMKEVLRVEVMPGRFEGAAPMPLRRASQHQPRGGDA